MWRDVLNDYFSFSKKERIAVVVLTILIIVIFILPYLVPERKQEVDMVTLKKFSGQLAEPDSLKTGSGNIPYTNSNAYHRYERTTNTAKTAVETLFYFDPNSLSTEGWKRLGLPDKTIHTIQNYLSKGGRFRSAKDLEKIYGFHKDDLQKLMPYVRLNTDAAAVTKPYSQGEVNHGGSGNKSFFFPAKNSSVTVDINNADTAAFIALPGIGSRLAARIVNFREKLGGFYAVDQVAETYALPDSTFKSIRPRLTLSETGVRKININTADVNELKQHPYIRWNVANAIVNFRLQHGNFQSPEDLLQIEIIPKEMYEKIAPYVSVQ